MKKIEFKSIKTKLVVSMVALVVISCVVLAAVSTINARNTVENEISGTFEAVGFNSQAEMTLFLQAGTDNVNLLATRTTIIDLLETEAKSGVNQDKRTSQNAALTAVNQRTSDAFTNIMVVNLNGEVISSNVPGNIGKSWKNNPLFTEGLKGNYFSEPYLNDTQSATIGYSTRVLDSGNTPIGVVIAPGPMAYLESVVLSPSGLGSTAQGMLVDTNQGGLFISNVQGVDGVADATGFLTKKINTDQILEGKLNYWHNYAGKDVVGSRYAIKEKPGWYLIFMEDQGEALASVNAMILMMVLITLLIIIAGAAFAYYLARSIATPIVNITEISDKIALGETNLTVSYESRDELGHLASSFRKMLENFKGKAAASEELSKGNLDVKFPVASDNDTLGLSMRHLRITITDLVTQILNIASKADDGDLRVRGDPTRFQGDYAKILTGLNSTLDSIINPVNEAMRLSRSYAEGNYVDRISDQLSVKGDFIPFKEALNQIGIQGSSAIGGVKNEVESLSAGMEQTNASAEEVASSTSMLAQGASSVSTLAEKSGEGIRQTLTAMEDLSNTVNSVATKAEQASSMAQQTVVLSEKGVSLAGKAEKGMQGIMHSVDETSVIITDITGQMEEIGKIVDVISGIADQTGLLALNAAIEAARAGEAGMGFAVVADEVKSLALESQKSAENIATIIGNLQKKSVKVSESMKISATEVKSGNEAVTETLEVFHEIVQAINGVHSNMTEVAAATEEQSAAVEEITASVNEVGSLVQKTAEEAVGSAAATEEITASIDQITRAISEAAASVQNISHEMGRFTVS